MRTHHIALGVASLLAVSQAFADYSFSFTSRARHDGVGASAGQSGGFSFGGAASGSAGGDAAPSSPGSFPANDWFGAYSPLAGASLSPETFDAGIVGASGLDPCLDPVQWVLYASYVMACSNALDAPASARGKGKVIDSNPPAQWPPIATGGAGNSLLQDPTSGGIGQSSGPDSHHHHPTDSPPIATGGAGNSLFEDPTYGVGSYPIETSLTSGPPLELTTGSTPGAAPAPEPGTLALVGLALLGLAILPLRTRH